MQDKSININLLVSLVFVRKVFTLSFEKCPPLRSKSVHPFVRKVSTLSFEKCPPLRSKNLFLSFNIEIESQSTLPSIEPSFDIVKNSIHISTSPVDSSQYTHPLPPFFWDTEFSFYSDFCIQYISCF